jgi:ribosomal protein S8
MEAFYGVISMCNQVITILDEEHVSKGYADVAAKIRAAAVDALNREVHQWANRLNPKYKDFYIENAEDEDAIIDKDFAIGQLMNWMKEKMVHFMGIQAQSIQEYRFDQKEWPQEIGEYFAKKEEEWKEEQRGLERYLDPAAMSHYKTILKFPDGFFWADAGTGSCRDEGNAMRHCGNTVTPLQGDNLLSLRRMEAVKRQGKGDVQMLKPYLTFIRHANGNLGERKGFANEKPKPEFHPYIIKLLELKGPDGDWYIKGLQAGIYAIGNDWVPSDCTPELQAELSKVRPDIWPPEKVKGLQQQTTESWGNYSKKPHVKPVKRKKKLLGEDLTSAELDLLKSLRAGGLPKSSNRRLFYSLKNKGLIQPLVIDGKTRKGYVLTPDGREMIKESVLAVAATSFGLANSVAITYQLIKQAIREHKSAKKVAAETGLSVAQVNELMSTPHQNLKAAIQAVMKENGLVKEDSADDYRKPTEQEELIMKLITRKKDPRKIVSSLGVTMQDVRKVANAMEMRWDSRIGMWLHGSNNGNDILRGE